MWLIYILQCSDGTYYTGISSNVESRVERHNRGRGPQYTKLRRPVVLKYIEKVDTKSKARQREIEIKNFSVANKEKLIRWGTGKRFP